MKMQLLYFTLFFVLAFGHTQPKEYHKIELLRSWIVTQIDSIWQNVTDINWLMNTSKTGRTDMQLMNLFDHVCDRLDKNIPPKLNQEAFISVWAFEVISVEERGITGLYSNFRKYQEEVQNDLSSKYSYSRAWEDFAETVLENSDTTASIPNAMDRINKLILGGFETNHNNIFESVLKETSGKLCYVEQSPHKVLFDLYNSLQLTQLKGYTMMQFSWMLLRLYKKGEFTVESKLMRERYMERMVDQVKTIKEALKSADQAYWKCDPGVHVEGETYEQLTRLLQGYIQNEVDLNPTETCTENCGYYSYTKQHGCFKNQFCNKQRSCNGDIIDCQFIDADMWVCQADPRKSARRYDWIEYENGRVLGNKGNCYRKNKVDSWWRWLFWHCSYCFCICDDQTHSDRYFNLRGVMSNTEENKVVVGIRFVKNNGIMHLQIQEAQMLPYASVNESSLQWRPVDSYSVKDSDVKEGKDYLMLSYKQRAIDLDDLKAPEGYVVTGVKFRAVGTHLNLEVYATPFDFTTGLLEQPEIKSIWISNDNTDASAVSPRTQVVLKSAENPLHSYNPSVIDSIHDQYLLFTHSDIDLDAAQTTVPFFDAQIVAPQPPTLLSGIGIYHKGRPWFGGFLGVKVFTFDYSVYIKDEFPQLNETEYFGAN